MEEFETSREYSQGFDELAQMGEDFLTRDERLALEAAKRAAEKAN